MIPRIIDYAVEGNVLYPYVYLDLDLLIKEYDAIIINTKQVRRGKRRA